MKIVFGSKYLCLSTSPKLACSQERIMQHSLAFFVCDDCSTRALKMPCDGSGHPAEKHLKLLSSETTLSLSWHKSRQHRLTAGRSLREWKKRQDLWPRVRQGPTGGIISLSEVSTKTRARIHAFTYKTKRQLPIA